MDRIFWFDDSTLCESWLQSRTKIFSEGAGGYKQQIVSRVLWVGGISLILRFQAHFRLRECLLIRPIPSIIDLQDCSTVETGCWLLTLLRSLLCVVSGEEVEQQDSLPAPNWGIEPDTVHQAGAPSQTDDWVGSHHFEGLKIINQRIVGPCSIPSLQSRPIKTWIQDLTSSPFMREVTGGSWRITLCIFTSYWTARNLSLSGYRSAEHTKTTEFRPSAPVSSYSTWHFLDILGPIIDYHLDIEGFPETAVRGRETEGYGMILLESLKVTTTERRGSLAFHWKGNIIKGWPRTAQPVLQPPREDGLFKDRLELLEELLSDVNK